MYVSIRFQIMCTLSIFFNIYSIFLSFLGLGVQEPLTSWGVLISEGSREMETAWWLLIFPGIFMTITLASLNFIGDGLRDAIDPKEY